MKFSLAIAALVAVVPFANAAGVAWSNHYAPSLKQAKASHKPLMIDFRASYCGPCKVMDRKVYIDPSISSLSGKFVPVQLDVEAAENQALWKRFKNDTLPTIVFLSWDGKTVLSKNVGYLDVPGLKTRMEAALKLAH
jgi:thiol:disulfide interchange protein